jgi:hypothetical protein
MTVPYRFDFFAVFFEALRFFEAFFGTFLPLALASDSPIAIACLRLLTFLPERPLFNVPALRFFIARPTSVDAFFEYLRAMVFLRLAKNNHRWHAKFLARHSPLALTGDRRHFGCRGTTETPAARTAPSPDRGGFDDIDEVARRRPNDACGAGDDVRRSLAQGG